jgi:hypothetical protein
MWLLPKPDSVLKKLLFDKVAAAVHTNNCSSSCGLGDFLVTGVPLSVRVGEVFTDRQEE